MYVPYVPKKKLTERRSLARYWEQCHQVEYRKLVESLMSENSGDSLAVDAMCSNLKVTKLEFKQGHFHVCCGRTPHLDAQTRLSQLVATVMQHKPELLRASVQWVEDQQRYAPVQLAYEEFKPDLIVLSKVEMSSPLKRLLVKLPTSRRAVSMLFVAVVIALTFFAMYPGKTATPSRIEAARRQAGMGLFSTPQLM